MSYRQALLVTLSTALTAFSAQASIENISIVTSPEDSKPIAVPFEVRDGLLLPKNEARFKAATAGRGLSGVILTDFAAAAALIKKSQGRSTLNISLTSTFVGLSIPIGLSGTTQVSAPIQRNYYRNCSKQELDRKASGERTAVERIGAKVGVGPSTEDLLKQKRIQGRADPMFVLSGEVAQLVRATES